MLIDALARAVRESGAFSAAYEKLDAGCDASMGIASSARPLTVSLRYADTPQTMLVVVPGDQSAASFARSVAAFLGDENVLHFPVRSDFPFAPKHPDAREAAQRMAAAWALQTDSKKVVVASAASMVRALPPVAAGVCAPLVASTGSEVVDAATGELLSFDDVQAALVARGFQNCGDALEGPGSFCVRGGTIDVFCGNTGYPVRLDFFGDEVDEARRVVAATGQSIATLDSVEIFPVREYRLEGQALRRAVAASAKKAECDPVWREIFEWLEAASEHDGIDAALGLMYPDGLATLGDYLTDQGLSVLVEPRSLIDDAQRAFDDASTRATGSHVAVEPLYVPPSSLNFGNTCRLTLASIMRAGSVTDVNVAVKRSDVAGGAEKLIARLRSLVDQRYTVVFSVANRAAREDMKLLCVDNALPLNEILDAAPDANDDALGSQELSPAQRKRSANCSDHPYWHRQVMALKKGVVNIVDVDVSLGMVVPDAKIALISIHDLQSRNTSVRNRKHIDITEVTFPFSPGDYVVHAVHGIAHFKELVRQEVSGVSRDYLLLEYASGDALYVPVEQLDRVTRYVGPEGSSPRLTRLNTSDWTRQLTRARKAAKTLAFDLVDVYTRRASVQGFRFSADTPWQREMEEAFPYVETSDQLAAIADVKADMQSAKPMDRLICGDVGFGKTEVALRAAFKATQDNKQVMVLCPTTILAQQHYNTFKDRFDPFGVRVEVLSRFRTPAETSAALAGFADGSVSVLVGTHRLLSRDVNPRDLGLVIIDEEQRFGVGHKEQLKNLREHIDVLTLSATPIPRTMQMSLSGVRDMSLILSPPDNRRAVEVFVGEWDVDIVSDAIRRELQRHGQVYYVSNRVRTISEAVDRVSAAAGEARVGVAHGQMSKEELERVMEEFNAGTIDVLVATTIIESGIDNPHTNTLIIEDAQRLGLAQMYQLKGRVGRSNKQAYAYFMFPESAQLTEEATARLEAINEHRDLGSGMRVAMRDLEIRGAGSLLGAEQSGNMSAVGFDLFAQMISTAVDAARANDDAGDGLPAALSDITVNIACDAFIPEEYMPDADQRVLLYRRLACVDTVKAIEELLHATLLERPDMPQACRNLFTKAKIRTWADEHGVNTVSVAAGKLTLEPCEPCAAVRSKAKAQGARYVAATQKFSVPVKAFQVSDDQPLVEAVLSYLEGLEEAENAQAIKQISRACPLSAAVSSRKAEKPQRKPSTTRGTHKKEKVKLNIPTPPKNPSAPVQGNGRPVPFVPDRPGVAPDGRPNSNGTVSRTSSRYGARSAAGKARGARRMN